MSIEDELRAVWNKYEPQRVADEASSRIAREAEEKLKGVNEWRTRHGLETVGVRHNLQELGMQQAQAQYSAMGWATKPATWRHKMDAELLAVIRRHFT